METIVIDFKTYYLPASLTDVQKLIVLARKTGRQIRVRGAHHSVQPAINPDWDKQKNQENLFVLLSRMNGVKIDTANKTVVVEAGCHLGFDPFDPTGISTQENSLFAQLDDAGLAIQDMGGITHQTVGGFLSTGSAGGSTQFAFSDALQSITFLPAHTNSPLPVTVSRTEEPDVFYAVSVSMGLLGIIVSATFNLVSKFWVRGTESITTISKCSIDMSGEGTNASKISLRKFLLEKQYARLLWYPQPGLERVTVWEGSQAPPGSPNERKPYKEFATVLGSQSIPQIVAGIIYTAIGQWPRWLGNIFGTNTSLYKKFTAYVSENFFTKIFPHILPHFVVLDDDNKDHPNKPQEFYDAWHSTLCMDNNVVDQLFPVEFTELWIPFDNEKGEDQVGPVLQQLNAIFKTLYSQPHAPLPAGAFNVELYAGKANDFWMSPSYKTDVLRVDVFWFGNNAGSPAEEYYPLFWKALEPFGFRCHWGKYLPAASSGQGPGYLKRQLPKWDDFLDMRKKFDPNGIFLSTYWKEHLGMQTISVASSKPQPIGGIVPDNNGYYHPADKHDISLLVEYAFNNKAKVRVRGAGQSMSDSIYTDSFQPVDYVSKSAHINIMLDKIQFVHIDTQAKTVTVGAGCHLGFDPYDPTNTSTEENSLFYLLREAGLAIPNVTDAIHQTVAGFISTGSEAGSTTHSFFEAIQTIELIDGTGKEKTFSRPSPHHPDDPFFGVGLAMGLMGVIHSITLNCIDAFHVKGSESVTDDDSAPLQIFGEDNTTSYAPNTLPNLKTFLQQAEFARLLWWTYPTARRVVAWQAHTMKPEEYNDETGQPNHFTPKPYRDAFYPAYLPQDLPETQKYYIGLFLEVVVSFIFSMIGHWPRVIANLGNEIDLFGMKRKTADIIHQAEEQWPKAYPQVLNLFLPCKKEPQVFWDDWLSGLNMDKNEFSNNLLPSYHSELWVPLDRAMEVMNMLHDYYKFQFFPDSDSLNKNAANGCYVVEILGAKKSDFWMSPAYEQDSVRINLFSLKGTNEDVIEYFQQFWDLFFINNIPFRLHWGYFLPKPQSPEGVAYLKKQYPKWDAFLSLRETLDPHQVFVNQYWKNQLGIL